MLLECFARGYRRFMFLYTRAGFHSLCFRSYMGKKPERGSVRSLTSSVHSLVMLESFVELMPGNDSLSEGLHFKNSTKSPAIKSYIILQAPSNTAGSGGFGELRRERRYSLTSPGMLISLSESGSIKVCMIFSNKIESVLGLPSAVFAVLQLDLTS